LYNVSVLQDNRGCQTVDSRTLHHTHYTLLMCTYSNCVPTAHLLVVTVLCCMCVYNNRGLNRPHQTGEEHSHGFRTATTVPVPPCAAQLEPQVFTPSADAATPNLCTANRTLTTHADRSYPFCEPRCVCCLLLMAKRLLVLLVITIQLYLCM
jgi:hypothetical protein